MSQHKRRWLSVQSQQALGQFHKMHLRNLPISLLLALLDFSTLCPGLPLNLQPQDQGHNQALEPRDPKVTYTVVPIDGSLPTPGPGACNGNSPGRPGPGGGNQAPPGTTVTVEKTMPPTTVTSTIPANTVVVTQTIVSLSTVTVTESVIEASTTAQVSASSTAASASQTSVSSEPTSTSADNTTITTTATAESSPATTSASSPTRQPDDGQWWSQKYPSWNATSTAW
ncbi:hypothetical protein PpBr36_07316 [Pyricularia pennisetigena]|uniref:hypothetical protein n=1 Tax=Pyricularia pennisetigena TaxID=1578925 RepID=UPI00114E58BB|nr:hypothetical protein PpBr36_07316 [Pyricularia pennisetigena]TLS24982.1 hypothetical protein PpBr36_07316 [Pyricularia pennisetigena]